VSKRGRNFTIMLHRDGAVGSRSLRIPVWGARAALAVTTVVAILVLLGAVLYAPIVRTAARVPGLNREIARLESENAKVRRLAQTLAILEQRYEQLRTMLGGDVVPASTAMPGPVPIGRPLLARPPGAGEPYEPDRSVPSHWPIVARGIVTRGVVSASDRGGMHEGVDIAVPVGTPIRATGGATVAEAGTDQEYGLYVRLTHPDGFESMYGHASRLLVEVGDTVAAGEVIALSGSTGRSTAPHLHFEIRRDGRPIDPRSLVEEGG
jgi:murein DD-endopeptidase MepM/ murein hydrolase activator NlpD